MNSAPGKVWRPEGSNVARHFLQTGLQREDTCGMPGSLTTEALGGMDTSGWGWKISLNSPSPPHTGYHRPVRTTTCSL